MARRTLNRRELRIANEAAEATDTAAVEDGSEKKAPPVKKPAKKRKSRSKADKIIRYKAFWGVFNQSLKRVAMFDYHERSTAEKKAEELSGSQKSPHFVRPVKEPIEE
jgi:CRISPR/Cas system-associated protein Cas5 (RAMP superfamily)